MLNPENESNKKFEVVTVLLIFLVVVLMSIFLISILIIFIKKIKNLLQSQTKPYYYFILIFIVTQLALSVLVLFHILSGIGDEWENLT